MKVPSKRKLRERKVTDKVYQTNNKRCTRKNIQSNERNDSRQTYVGNCNKLDEGLKTTEKERDYKFMKSYQKKIHFFHVQFPRLIAVIYIIFVNQKKTN